ncbi:hypothetical protein PRIPAC_71923 [Pristionchus pacificus]|uniref:Uncharacterized protein n=1 Tax=Pristionchus pacificus TaxID=54126 RepID=A0A2A6C8S0_PRIPA|nr:hypothetical protein PRIPAC_71923 [Pristionchus pacificus]|eukprot:PDM74478.1 hypothetical protein PRIPAC_41834 [Pristionchus pacificus]
MKVLALLIAALALLLLAVSAARIRCPANANNVPGYARPTLASIGRQAAPRSAQVNLRHATILRAEEAAKKREADRKRKERAEKRRRTAEERAREEQLRQAAAAAQLNVPARPALPAPPQLQNQQPPLPPANPQPDNQQNVQQEEEQEEEEMENVRGDDQANDNDADDRDDLVTASILALFQRVNTAEEARDHRRTMRTFVRRLYRQISGMGEPEGFVSGELNAVVGIFVLVRDVSPAAAARFVRDSLQIQYVHRARMVLDHEEQTATVVLRIDSAAHSHNLVSDRNLRIDRNPARYVFPHSVDDVDVRAIRRPSFRLLILNDELSEFIPALLRTMRATSVVITTEFTAAFGREDAARIAAVFLNGLLLQGAEFQVVPMQ